MTILTFTLAIFGTSILAGLLGALTGLGGGVVIVPVLALLFHVDHALRHRRLARLGHRHVLGRGRSLRARRLLQYSHRHVP